MFSMDVGEDAAIQAIACTLKHLQTHGFVTVRYRWSFRVSKSIKHRSFCQLNSERTCVQTIFQKARPLWMLYWSQKLREMCNIEIMEGK